MAHISGLGIRSATIGRQLAISFGVLIAVAVGAIALSLFMSSRADRAWSNAAHWNSAVEAAGLQQTGTREQMRTQSMGVALMDPTYRKAFNDAIAQSNRGASVIDGLGDPVIAQLSASANAADHAHDAAANDKLWPAVEKGDAAAAEAALKVADLNAGKVFVSLEKIGRRLAILTSAAHSISATAEQATHSTGGIARAMADAAGSAERQVELISHAALAASGARDAAEEGRGQSSRASEAMDLVRTSSQQVTGVIGELGEKSGRIEGIVSTITGLAEQTNLLALNAAIEAARAGDQGRGFAVVAEEVSKLADESQRAAGSISVLITEIQGATRRAVEVAEEGDRRIRSGSETVEHSRGAFERISSAALQVNSALDEVSSMAESTSAATEEVAASTVEMTTSSRQVAEGAEDLVQTASRLDELVLRFRV